MIATVLAKVNRRRATLATPHLRYFVDLYPRTTHAIAYGIGVTIRCRPALPAAQP